MYSFSSATGISANYLSSSFIFKNLSSNLTSRSFFERYFENRFFNLANRNKLSLDRFSRAHGLFVQRLSGDILFSMFIHHKWNFVVRVVDWTNDSYSKWNVIVRALDCLRSKSVRILFTMIFVDKSQYLWNKLNYITSTNGLYQHYKDYNIVVFHLYQKGISYQQSFYIIGSEKKRNVTL